MCISKGLHTASYYGSLSLVLENSEQLSSFLKPRTVLNTQCCFYPVSQYLTTVAAFLSFLLKLKDLHTL